MKTPDSWKLLGYGNRDCLGQPGSKYIITRAKVYQIHKNRYCLNLLVARGSNQGYLDEYERIERQYRESNIECLMKFAIQEVRQDDMLTVKDDLVAAIYDACYEAEDSFKQEEEKNEKANHNSN